MPSIVTSDIRVTNATNFAFFNGLPNVSFYMGIGRTIPWAAFGFTDSNPPTPNDNVAGKKTLRDSLIALKRLTSADIRMGIKRYNWTSGTIYTQYDCNDGDLFRKQFYVYTPAGSVYKCISNNSGALSTVMPTGDDVNGITTSDGYVWKFMYTVSAGDVERFVTPHYIPVINVSNNVWTPATDPNPFAPNHVLPFATVNGGTYVEGHGANNLFELGAYYVIINGLFSFDEGGKVTTNNDFRRIILMKDIRDASNAVGLNALYNMTTRINLVNQSGQFSQDQQITISTGPSAYIVDVGSNYITLTGNIADIPTSGTISSSTATATIASVVYPEAKKYSGNVLFIENRTPIARAIDQVESLNVILEF